MEAKEELWKRIRGALVGIAFGDSFGMPVEMWSREKNCCRVRKNSGTFAGG